MLFAASCTPGTVQYKRVCPRFPLPDSFPPGRLSWDGDWQKKRRRGGRGGGGASLYNQSCLDQQNDLPPRPPVHAYIVRRAAVWQKTVRQAAVQMKRRERQHLHRKDRFCVFLKGKETQILYHASPT